MNDHELITALREQRGKVPMDTPVEQIIRRGRAVRARRRVPQVAAALGTAAAAAFAVSLALPASHPASEPHAQLAAWTVGRQPDGSIKVTIRELRDPAGLQQRLRADGVPASVTFSSQQNPACQGYPGGGSQSQRPLPALPGPAWQFRGVLRAPGAGQPAVHRQLELWQATLPFDFAEAGFGRDKARLRPLSPAASACLGSSAMTSVASSGFPSSVIATPYVAGAQEVAAESVRCPSKLRGRTTGKRYPDLDLGHSRARGNLPTSLIRMHQPVRGIRLGDGGQRRVVAIHCHRPRSDNLACRPADMIGAVPCREGAAEVIRAAREPGRSLGQEPGALRHEYFRCSG